MKPLLLSLSLALVGVSSASAQIYQPTVVRDSVVGAVAGALIGGHNHDRWAQGAVIGAAAGALVGATIDQPRTVVYSAPPVVQTAMVPDAPMVATAPMVGAPAPQVVYVSAPAPRVVYVRSYADPVYYGPPVFVSFGWRSGGYWRGGYGHGGYSHGGYGHGHPGHSDHHGSGHHR